MELGPQKSIGSSIISNGCNKLRFRPCVIFKVFSLLTKESETIAAVTREEMNLMFRLK